MTEPEEPEEEGNSRRSRDPETRVIDAILRMLDDVSEKAKTRIVEYIYARFQDKGE